MHVVEGVLLPPALQAALTAATPEPARTDRRRVATPEVGVAPERPDLLALLTNDPDARFTTLLAAIDAAGLNDTVSTGGPFTLLAPTNDAFAALFDQLGITADDALANRSLVNQVLLYHLVKGRSLYHNLTGGANLPTMLLGQSVTFALDTGVLSANGVEISDTDNIASNGVMHVVEGVLLPPALQAALTAATPEPTPEPTAAATPEVGVAPERPNLIALLTDDPDGRFTTLLAMLDAAGQTSTLTGTGPFTLLAPTNDAFAAMLEQFGLTEEQALANPNIITQVLLYHIIPGRYLYHNLTGGATLPTALSGQSVTFALDAGVLSANGIEISDTDNIASNGVMHVVEGIVLPPAIQSMLAVQEPTPEPTAESTEVGVAPARPDLLALLTNDADARFTTLLAAVDAAGLSDSLTGAGPYTVLAPTNDAFDALFAQTSLSLDQLAAMPDVLSEILRFHVIPGRYLYHNLTTGATLNTALVGQSVTFALETGALTANGVEISDTDNIASNGVMHAVDAVLLPSDLQASLMSNPRIRVAHFSPDAGSVDIYVNGTLTSMTGVAFPDVTPWVNVNPGTYEIGIAPAGGAPVLTVSVDAASGQWLLIAVTGSQAQGTLQANVIAEDFSPLAADTARLSMFNGVEGSSPYNVTVDGNAVVIRLGYPGTLGNNDGYYSADVPAGTYSVQFVLTSQTSNVVLDLPDVTLDAGTSYLLAVAGSPDAPGAVNVATVVPAQ
ncbi:MAG: fasciclin domain-containing protein [Anaerolineae bacterium]